MFMKDQIIQRNCVFVVFNDFFKVYSKDFYFIIFLLLQKFDCDEWGIGLDVMQVVLQLEKIVNQFLFDFYKVVDSYKDVQVKYVVFVFLNVF